MSHDKIKAAARERIAGTGEPFSAARREVITEYQASASQVPLPGTRMLVWINGPCGVGKTATAFELHRRLPGSVVCDPAHVGYGMRRMLPAPIRRGFWQDIPAWRHAVRETPPPHAGRARRARHRPDDARQSGPPPGDHRRAAR